MGVFGGGAGEETLINIGVWGGGGGGGGGGFGGGGGHASHGLTVKGVQKALYDLTQPLRNWETDC